MMKMYLLTCLLAAIVAAQGFGMTYFTVIQPIWGRALEVLTLLP